MNALEYLGPLDELIQVIYQGINRFVLVSKVDDESWTLHLGLTKEGRWWQGRWVNADILALMGSKPSSKLLDNFAEQLVKTFVQGELFIGNWKAEKGAEINVAFDPTGKKPIVVPLTELSYKEAATYAANEFFSIAIQAQPRKCRLNPSPFQAAVPDPMPSIRPSPPRGQHKRRDPSPEPSEADTKAQDQIKSLREQLAQARARVAIKSPPPESKPAPKPHQGASIANPRKKARKYQAIEFESDEE